MEFPFNMGMIKDQSEYRKPASEDIEASNTTKTDENSAQYSIPWYIKFLHWVITIDDFQSYQFAGIQRNYQALPRVSNYIFLCGGRFQAVSKTKYLSVLVLLLIILVMVLFSVFEVANIWNHIRYGRPLVLLFYYFWLLTLVSFIRTSSKDPGALPRNIHLPQLRNSCGIPSEYYNTIMVPAPKNHIQLKYCVTCRIWRPLRASHCSICDACILAFDHHCIWVNNCIGQRNYTYFLTFLFSSSLALIFMTVSCALKLSHANSMKESPVSLILICLTASVIWYLLILSSYHIFLTSVQHTTHEYVKNIKSNNPLCHPLENTDKNPFFFDSYLKNMTLLMCQRRGFNTLAPQKRHSEGDWRFLKIPVSPSFGKL